MNLPLSPEPPFVLKPGDLDELFALAREDFVTFVVLVFSELHHGKDLKPAPYIEVIAELLMDVEDGRERRLIVNMPPGFM